MILISLLSFFISNAFAELSNSEKLSQIDEIKSFAFGSCSEQHHDGKIWNQILKDKVDMFIWGGDNVYADSKNPDVIKRAYETQEAETEYREFIFRTPIIGTWDDHDYGYNNAKGNFAHKHISQKYLLDFLHEPFNSPRRFQEGVYTSYEFGPQERSIKFILLDNRYFKDQDKRFPLLGQKQWEWLEKELTNSKAKVHFIMSGIPITAPRIIFGEEWGDYKIELSRLLNLIKTRHPQGVVLLSGDKHFAGIFQRYNQLEFMASGLTHSAPASVRKILAKNFDTSFFGKNYGHIKINWQTETPILEMSSRDIKGRERIRRSFIWDKNSFKWIKWH